MTDTLTGLVAEYQRHAAAHARATEAGDSRKANANHNKLLGVLQGIRAFKQRGSDALLALLQTDDVGVRLWAATHSLGFHEQEAKEVLRQVSDEDGLVGFTAEMVLDEWESGTLKTP